MDYYSFGNHKFKCQTKTTVCFRRSINLYAHRNKRFHRIYLQHLWDTDLNLSSEVIDVCTWNNTALFNCPISNPANSVSSCTHFTLIVSPDQTGSHDNHSWLMVSMTTGLIILSLLFCRMILERQYRHWAYKKQKNKWTINNNCFFNGTNLRYIL